MYIPKYFRVEDLEEIQKFIQEHSFAIVISADEQKVPVATHVPLLLEKHGDITKLSGHLSIGNPQWKIFEKNPQILAIFQGPHSYISSSWYKQQNVPTWNYTAVHAYGRVEIMKEELLRVHLSQMMKKYESGREDGVMLEQMSPDYIESLIKGIVGFEITIEKFEAKYKLSQNKNSDTVKDLIDGLEKEGKPESTHIANKMKEIQRTEG